MQSMCIYSEANHVHVFLKYTLMMCFCMVIYENMRLILLDQFLGKTEKKNVNVWLSGSTTTPAAVRGKRSYY